MPEFINDIELLEEEYEKGDLVHAQAIKLRLCDYVIAFLKKKKIM